MRRFLWLLLALMFPYSLSALRPPRVLRKAGSHLTQSVSGVDNRLQWSRPSRIWLSDVEEGGSSTTEVLRKVALAPFALLKILTAPGRNALSWINRELPMLKFLWPDDDMRLKAFLLGSLAFMFAGKWVNVQGTFIMQSAIEAA